MTNKEILSDVKTKLKMYKPYIRKIKQCMEEIESLEARIFKIGGSFVKMPDGTNTPNIHKNSPLWREIEEWENEIKKYSLTIDQVNNFLNRLTLEEKEIIDSLFIKNNYTQEKLGQEKSYSREGMRDRVDRLIIKLWKY